MSKIFHRLRVLLPGIVILPVLAACAAARWEDTSGQDTHQNRTSSAGVVTTTPLNQISSTENLYSQLLAHYDEWEGVPYKFGGQSRNGIDCSAFVQQAAYSVLGINLPRTTRQQMATGGAIDKTRAEAGDMVFFKTGTATNHVGIYLGQNKFMHASESRGVAISRIDDTYWKPRLMEFRRIR